jgi:hypothetical protein
MCPRVDRKSGVIPRRIVVRKTLKEETKPPSQVQRGTMEAAKNRNLAMTISPMQKLPIASWGLFWSSARGALRCNRLRPAAAHCDGWAPAAGGNGSGSLSERPIMAELKGWPATKGIGREPRYQAFPPVRSLHLTVCVLCHTH